MESVEFNKIPVEAMLCIRKFWLDDVQLNGHWDQSFSKILVNHDE